jgi:hypothetical protein
MSKTGVSVTLEDANLLWLRSRTISTKGRSLSETLDDLVTAARTGGAAPAAITRSVVGTIDIAADDAGLDRADAYVQDVFDRSLARPFVARETPPPHRTGKTRGTRRG